MSARTSIFLLAAALGLSASACKPSAEQPKPDWLKQPASYQPAAAPTLTFNKAGLEKYNFMDTKEREAFVAQLIQNKDSFEGQAIVKAGTGVSAHVPEHKFGTWEITARAEEILYEISINYALYTTPELGRGIARNRAVQFRGTVIGVEYQGSNKPRELTVRVKVSEIKALE